jgi:hypothetical protein
VTVIFNDADRSNASSNGFNLFVKLLIIGGVSWLSCKYIMIKHS